MKNKFFDSASVVEKTPLNPQVASEDQGLIESFEKMRSHSIASIESFLSPLAIAPHHYYLKIFQSDCQWSDRLQFRLNGNGTPISLNALHATGENLLGQMGGAA